MTEETKLGWHPAEIICALKMKGETLASVGAKLTPKLSRKTLSWALVKPHWRANQAIADFLGVPLHELWPQWFDEDGKLISTQPIPRPNAQPTLRAIRPSMPRRRAA